MKKSLLKNRILENVSTIALAFVLGAPALQAADDFILMKQNVGTTDYESLHL